MDEDLESVLMRDLLALEPDTGSGVGEYGDVADAVPKAVSTDNGRISPLVAVAPTLPHRVPGDKDVEDTWLQYLKAVQHSTDFANSVGQSSNAVFHDDNRGNVPTGASPKPERSKSRTRGAVAAKLVAHSLQPEDLQNVQFVSHVDALPSEKAVKSPALSGVEVSEPLQIPVLQLSRAKSPIMSTRVPISPLRSPETTTSPQQHGSLRPVTPSGGPAFPLFTPDPILDALATSRNTADFLEEARKLLETEREQLQKEFEVRRLAQLQEERRLEEERHRIAMEVEEGRRRRTEEAERIAAKLKLRREQQAATQIQAVVRGHQTRDKEKVHERIAAIKAERIRAQEERKAKVLMLEQQRLERERQQEEAKRLAQQQAMEETRRREAQMEKERREAEELRQRALAAQLERERLENLARLRRENEQRERLHMAVQDEMAQIVRRHERMLEEQHRQALQREKERMIADRRAMQLEDMYSHEMRRDLMRQLQAEKTNQRRACQDMAMEEMSSRMYEHACKMAELAALTAQKPAVQAAATTAPALPARADSRVKQLVLDNKMRSARRIQAVWRGYKTRRHPTNPVYQAKVRRLWKQAQAATIIQAFWRGYRVRAAIYDALQAAKFDDEDQFDYAAVDLDSFIPQLSEDVFLEKPATHMRTVRPSSREEPVAMKPLTAPQSQGSLPPLPTQMGHSSVHSNAPSSAAGSSFPSSSPSVPPGYGGHPMPYYAGYPPGAYPMPFPPMYGYPMPYMYAPPPPQHMMPPVGAHMPPGSAGGMYGMVPHMPYAHAMPGFGPPPSHQTGRIPTSPMSSVRSRRDSFRPGSSDSTTWELSSVRTGDYYDRTSSVSSPPSSAQAHAKPTIPTHPTTKNAMEVWQQTSPPASPPNNPWGIRDPRTIELMMRRKKRMAGEIIRPIETTPTPPVGIPSNASVSRNRRYATALHTVQDDLPAREKTPNASAMRAPPAPLSSVSRSRDIPAGNVRNSAANNSAATAARRLRMLKQVMSAGVPLKFGALQLSAGATTKVIGTALSPLRHTRNSNSHSAALKATTVLQPTVALPPIGGRARGAW